MIVYCVDDERPGLMLLKKAIEEAIPSNEPVCFESSAELLEASKKEIPDLVFSDIEMPEMNGLELAKELNSISNDIRIVFVTGYTDYAMEAFDVFASGYIMKPARGEQIKKVLERISFVKNKKKDITIKVFGNFDIAYKGKSVSFRSPKSREMLAYLVDRDGAFVSRQEMAGILFEDDFSRNTQSHLSHIASGLKEDLGNAGIHDFFFSNNGYSLDMSLVDSDLNEYRNGKKSLFLGEYMEQYEWAEYRKADFKKNI